MTKQRDDNETREMARAARRYALGEIDGHDRDEFEICLLSKPNLTDILEEVEYDLCEEYLNGVLPASERKQFESFFLRSDSHQVMLASMGALHAVDLFGENASQIPHPIPPVTDSAALRTRRWFSFAAACAAVIVILIGAFFLFRFNKADSQSSAIEPSFQSKTDKASSANNNSALDQGNDGTAHVNSNRNSTGSQGKPARNRNGSALKGATFADILVTLGLIRGTSNTPTLTLAANTRTARITVELPETTLKDYRIVLKHSDGTLIQTRPPTLDTTRQTLSTAVKSRRLSKGQYSLTVIGKREDDEEETVGTATFQVLHK